MPREDWTTRSGRVLRFGLGGGGSQRDVGRPVRFARIGQDVRGRRPRRDRGTVGGYEEERGARALVDVRVQERLVRLIEVRGAVIVMMMMSIALRMPPAVGNLERGARSGGQALPHHTAEQEKDGRETHFGSIPAG